MQPPLHQTLLDSWVSLGVDSNFSTASRGATISAERLEQLGVLGSRVAQLDWSEDCSS